MLIFIYDLEVFPNCFVYNGKFEGRPEIYTFEISTRKNQRNELLQHLSYLGNCKAVQVGFNNLNFDYVIEHSLMTEPYTFDHTKAHQLAQSMIGSQRFGAGHNPHSIRLRDRLLPQIDLMKINHFDNVSKATSLKALQFAMRMQSVEDLPFDPNTILTLEQMDTLIAYGVHDIHATELFLSKCKHLVLMRKELLEHGILSGDVLNYSDVKIGTDYLVNKIGRNKCFISGSNPRQTLRTSVAYRDVVLSKIEFHTEQFQAVLEWFKSQIYYFGRDARPTLEATLGKIKFKFGAGGVHASVSNRKYESNDQYVIRDVDVSGMYPAVCIANGFAPEHLGQAFVQAYSQLQRDRSQYPKGTTMNKVLKLAGNGASGNFESKFSCLFDIKCAHAMRINGQLQLIQLAEFLSLIPGLELIQANTDGITSLVRRDTLPLFEFWCKEWEALTGLKLEKLDYKKMWIRDCNNYLAEPL